MLSFFWKNNNTQKKFETMVMQNLRERKVLYVLCENGELNRWRQKCSESLGILGILFICHKITIITKRCQKKKNVGRDGEEA